MAELKVGWLIAEHLLRNVGTESYVGFPLKPDAKADESAPGYTLRYLMDNDGLIADEDYDIALTLNPRDKTDLNLVEVTRVAGRKKGEFTDSSSVIRLLQKKYKVQPDPRIILAISVDNDCRFDSDSVLRFIDSHDSPYGRIWLIGMISAREWTFRFSELYPEQVQLGDFSLT